MPRACVVRPRIAPVRLGFAAAIIDAFVMGPPLMAFWIGVIRVYRVREANRARRRSAARSPEARDVPPLAGGDLDGLRRRA
jgi:hypothetical protein